jgi:curved DNA-binding protein CbpA
MQQRVPTPVPGVDIYKLPLSTLEGFVLSRVDGAASVEDISIMSGIDMDQVLSILTRLADLGAVELSWLGARARRTGNNRQPAVTPGTNRQPAVTSGTNRQPIVPGRAPEPVAAPDAHFAPRTPRFDPSENDSAVQIPVESRRRISNAFLAMEGMNLYQVLGLPRSADKKAIRNAYFELSKLFHPDAYFGRELGSFKGKMEAVFKRLTEAYDTLGKAKRRAEYDEYLASTEQTTRARRTLQSIDLADIEAHRAAAARAHPPDEPNESAERSTSPRVAISPPSAPPAEREARVPPPPPSPPRPQPTNAERRARVRDRLLQRMKVVSSMRPPAPGGKPSEPPSDAAGEGDRDQRRRNAIDGLRQSITASSAVTSTPNAQIQSLLRKAAEAEQASDVLQAATHLQLALSIEPNNPDILREYDRVSKVVARNLAANYEKQALYEEKTGNWQAAARSWCRASDGKPDDPNAARRTAEAMLKASSDLYRAQVYAQRAVSLARSVENLTVLARVYLAAGLKLNAIRELEKAAQLAPKDEMVNNLLREVR